MAYSQSLAILGEAPHTALALPIRWCDVDHMAVLHLAMGNDLTTYDASYLYLARELGARLVTFDGRLARAAAKTGSRDTIPPKYGSDSSRFS